jgi:gluconolactonase
MRRIATGLAALLALAGPLSARAQEAPRRIDLGTAEGARAVKAEWRYAPATLVPVEFKGQDGTMQKGLDISPHAEAPGFDDSAWEVLDPTTLGQRRGPGKVCFAWYRVKVTLPEGVAGKAVRFSTVVDDYGEVWVDGKLPYKAGQNGGAIVAGFNAANVVELADPNPGKTYSIAVFGINGPISVAPINRIFLRDTFLEIAPK